MIARGLKTCLTLIMLLPGVIFAQDEMWEDDDWDDADTPSRWTGFVETGFGSRFSRDAVIANRDTLEEIRWQLQSDWQAGTATISFKGDAAYDRITTAFEGDLRELTAAFPIGSRLDVKIGRQVQTWGTGDLVFLNDLFPKDFQSFFAGRDDEHLKAPGNAMRLTWFSSPVNVDFVWTPEFEPDRYLTGERFSFFSPLAGSNIAPQPPLNAIEPRKSLSNGEIALRLFKNFEGKELAVYLYDGFFKQPTALTAEFESTFAPMTAFGASLRQPMGRGIVNFEFSLYRSNDDRNGSNPLLPNSQARLLAGYEWEAMPSFTVALQYYLENTLNYNALIDNSPFPDLEADEYRHVLSNRLTYRTGRDKHIWSLFTFFSPSDNDFHLRPAYNYRHDDQWSLSVGANLFGGDQPQTFFSQLRDASNAYVRLRYNY